MKLDSLVGYMPVMISSTKYNSIIVSTNGVKFSIEPKPEPKRRFFEWVTEGTHVHRGEFYEHETGIRCADTMIKLKNSASIYREVEEANSSPRYALVRTGVPEYNGLPEHNDIYEDREGIKKRYVHGTKIIGMVYTIWEEVEPEYRVFELTRENSIPEIGEFYSTSEPYASMNYAKSKPVGCYSNIYKEVKLDDLSEQRTEVKRAYQEY